MWILPQHRQGPPRIKAEDLRCDERSGAKAEKKMVIGRGKEERTTWNPSPTKMKMVRTKTKQKTLGIQKWTWDPRIDGRDFDVRAMHFLLH